MSCAAALFDNLFIGHSELFAGFEEASEKQLQGNVMDKENLGKPKRFTVLSLKENENIDREGLVFVVHPSEPATSTPLQVNFLDHSDEKSFTKNYFDCCILKFI